MGDRVEADDIGAIIIQPPVPHQAEITGLEAEEGCGKGGGGSREVDGEMDHIGVVVNLLDGGHLVYHTTHGLLL